MISKPLVTFVFGTRPEAIKLAPVIRVFRDCDLVSTRIVLTGQHSDMTDNVMKLFGLSENNNLNLMHKKQSLCHITSRSLLGLKEEFLKYRPQLLIIQGDTSTSFSAALAAFYEKIPIAHVEAGLRTNNIFDPFPEESNRRLIAQIVSLHFAPTELAKNNLVNSGVEGQVYMTGNTIIDSIFAIENSSSVFEIEGLDLKQKKLILVTIHRRENWGLKIKSIAEGIIRIVNKFPDVLILLPMHLNPIVREDIINLLDNHPRVILTEPFDYDKLIFVIKKSFCILTDSGGIQEEAPVFGKPVLVLRDTTERIESINAGTSKLIGTDSNTIEKEASILINEPKVYEKMSRAVNPYGDGKSSKRILNICLNYLNNNK